MQSKTSCFNKTLFRKHVTRFWPIWAAYFGVWLLILPLGLLGARTQIAQDPMYVRQTLLDCIAGGGVTLSLIFSVLAAMGVWSFLYSSRSASGAACLPLTRTAQFTSAVLGGLVPLVCANIVIFLLTALAEASLGALHLPSLLTWLGVTVLVLLFFYGFATFCAMLTGNLIVLPAVYLVLNFTAVGFGMLLTSVARWFLYGYTGGDLGFGFLSWLSPAVPLLRHIGSESRWMEDPVTGTNIVTEVRFHGWGVAAVYAVVGLLLLLAAWALLRRRKMETAGDVVAVQVLKPVFRWCMGIGGALCFANMMLYIFQLSGTTQKEIFALTALYLVIGAFIGWFAGEMLIRRSFRAFSRGMRGWAGWALCCVVLLAGLAATELDLLGFEKRQPKAEKVEAVAVQADGAAAYLETPEGVAAALEMHRGVIANKARQDQCSEVRFFTHEYDGYSTISLHLSYLLKNGGIVERVYTLPHVAGVRDDAVAVQELLNRPEAVQARKETPFPFTQDNVRFGTVRAVMTAAECAAAAGYDDPAEYILCEMGGYTRQEAAKLSDAERSARVSEFLNDYYKYGFPYYDADSLGSYYAKWFIDRPVPASDDAAAWDSIWLEYTLTLSDAEAWEFYSTCVLPDSADGKLGRVWILADEPDYAETACAASIEITAERPPQGDRTAVPVKGGTLMPMPTAEGGYSSFTTTPTIDAQRTAAFLAARGVRLHTPAELRAAAER